MSQQRKNFITKNTSFVCQNCDTKNSPAKKTCRNHCKECLYSLHLDKEIPGDRASKCLGLMKPIEIGQNSKKGFFVIHQCTKCGKTIRNKLAEDDNWQTVCEINNLRSKQPVQSHSHSLSLPKLSKLRLPLK